jgi:hypothetical protein
MATVFKNKLQTGLGTTNSTVLTTEANAKTTVVGLSLTNLTESIVLASIQIEDTVAATSAYYIKEVVIPPNQSLRVVNGGERLVLGVSTKINIQSNIDNSLDLVLSYVEII